MVTTIHVHDLQLSTLEENRIQRHLAHLEQRIETAPEAVATVSAERIERNGMFVADLRLQLGHHGEQLVGREEGTTVDHAVRLAVEDVERQLIRLREVRRGH